MSSLVNEGACANQHTPPCMKRDFDRVGSGFLAFHLVEEPLFYPLKEIGV